MKPNSKVLKALKAKLKAATIAASKLGAAYYALERQHTKARHAVRKPFAAKIHALDKATEMAVSALRKKQRKGLDTAYKTKNAAWDELSKIKKAIMAEETKECAPPPMGTAFVAYKKAYTFVEGPFGGRHQVIVTLEVPAKAHRQASGLSGGNKKCRCSEAKVLKMEFAPRQGKHKGDVPVKYKVYSGYRDSFVYAVGATVRPKQPYTMQQEICASGIHFYMRREDAEAH